MPDPTLAQMLVLHRLETMTRRILAIAFTHAVVAVAYLSAAKPTEMQKAVSTELVGKAFSTKIPIGSYIQLPGAGGQEWCYKLIDTEYAVNGEIKYEARKGCYTDKVHWYGDLFSNTYFVDKSQMTQMFGAGSATLWVTGVEFKDNRIEIQLSYSPKINSVRDYAKLKLMLGKGYESWSKEQVMSSVASALRIEYFEHIAELQNEFLNLTNRLSSARKLYQQTELVDPPTKLERAQELKSILEGLQSNRLDYLHTARVQSVDNSYGQQLAILEPEISRLESEVREQRILALNRNIKGQEPALATLRTALKQRPPDNIAEWDSRSSDLNRYEQILKERATAYASLEENGQPPDQSAMVLLVAEQNHALELRRTLNQSHDMLQLRSLNQEYQSLSHRRDGLMDKYLRAFGTSQERPALQLLISHIDLMKENRATAQRLGDSTAANQSRQLDAELARLKKR